MPPLARPSATRRTHAALAVAVAAGLLVVAPPQVHAQGFDDATFLALQLGGQDGQIRLDEELAGAIAAELALIRAQVPAVAAIHVLHDWVPGELMVRMTDEALAELEAGTFTGFDDLFAEYPVVGLHFFDFIPWVHITFFEPLHAPNLVPLVLAVDGVTIAEPNYTLGDGDDITIAELGHYTFKHGWGDCLAGCIYNHYWEIQIQDGVATVVQEWGDDVPVAVQARSLSAVKALYR